MEPDPTPPPARDKSQAVRMRPTGSDERVAAKVSEVAASMAWARQLESKNGIADIWEAFATDLESLIPLTTELPESDGIAYGLRLAASQARSASAHLRVRNLPPAE